MTDGGHLQHRAKFAVELAANAALKTGWNFGWALPAIIFRNLFAFYRGSSVTGA